MTNRITGDSPHRVAAQHAQQIASTQRPKIAAAEQAREAERAEKAGKTEGSETAPRGDQLQASPEARLAHRIARALEGQPGVRADVVASVRARMAAGEFRADPERIAQGIVDTALGRRA